MKWSLFALLIGFGIDLIVGDPHGLPHPVVGIGKLISLLERRFRALFPKTARGEIFAGACIWLRDGHRHGAAHEQRRLHPPAARLLLGEGAGLRHDPDHRGALRGPAAAVRAMSRFGCLKLRISTGTGFAQPKRNSAIIKRPPISTCRSGLSVSRPARLAVGSPRR